MPLAGRRTFVGFGFGPIQAGLFLYEAYRSGRFGRLVVAEITPVLVDSIRAAGGWYSVNVAHSDRRETAHIGPVEILNPQVEAEREALTQSVSEAEEIATAIPSVEFYTAGGPGSVHNILAQGLLLKVVRNPARAVIYAAENHNYAAEMLQEHVFRPIPLRNRPKIRQQVRFLNTVIGKMSGIVSCQAQEQELAPITPQSQRAFLVEEFNRIFITRLRFGRGPVDFERGLSVFEERDDLLPFEEAKLYGHNATHALAAYLGAALGLSHMADLRRIPGVMTFLHAAFVRESGEALIRRHQGTDPLFTAEGYRRYAEDLLDRMTNPYLLDTVQRVGRDAARKLGWNDRLVGTMRLALRYGIIPLRYAFGAAAALGTLQPAGLDTRSSVLSTLAGLWEQESPEPDERDAVMKLIETAHDRLRSWREAGFQPQIEQLFDEEE